MISDFRSLLSILGFVLLVATMYVSDFRCLLSILGFVLLMATMYDIWVYQHYLVEAENRAEEDLKGLVEDTEEHSGVDSPLLGKKKYETITKPAHPGQVSYG